MFSVNRNLDWYYDKHRGRSFLDSYNTFYNRCITHYSPYGTGCPGGGTSLRFCGCYPAWCCFLDWWAGLIAPSG